MASTDGNAVMIRSTPMASAVSAARRLGRSGVPVIGIASHPDHPLLHSKFCSERQLVPDPQRDLQGYIRSIQEIAERPDVLTMLPMSEADIFVLTTYRSKFEPQLSLPLIQAETFRNVSDKFQLVATASDLGIATPETELLSEKSSWDSPAIVKSRYSILRADNRLHYPGVRFLPDGEAPNKGEIRNEMGHDPIVQEFIPPNGEFGFFALYADGDLRASFQHRRIRSTKYAGGASVFRKAVNISRLRTHGTRLLERMDWTGPAMVEFRRDRRTGAFVLMEINPRFWGSLPLAIHAGVGFPLLYVDLAKSGECEHVADYHKDVSSQFVRGEMQHLLSLISDEYPSYVAKPGMLKSLLSILRTVPRSSFDMLDINDPAPFFYDFKLSAKKMASNISGY